MSTYPRRTTAKPPTVSLAGRPIRRTAALAAKRLYASGVEDIGRVPFQCYVPPVPARQHGCGAYSAAVLAVAASYNPTPHSQYR